MKRLAYTTGSREFTLVIEIAQCQLRCDRVTTIVITSLL